jgi:ubiquinone/menaquinone biosynthesis C-methylase UbiE
MLHPIIEALSNFPRFFLFCRGLLEDNFRIIRSRIGDHLGSPTEGRVLEVACGPGAFSDLFPPDRYTGIDLNPRYIRFAKKNFTGDFHVQDARKLDFPEGSFDQVLVYGLLHHLNDEDVSAVLTSLTRVLRPKGHALVIEDVPTESKLNVIGHLVHWAENGHHIRAADQYRKLLEAHFDIDEEQRFRSGVCDYYLARMTAK